MGERNDGKEMNGMEKRKVEGEEGEQRGDDSLLTLTSNSVVLSGTPRHMSHTSFTHS